MRGVYKFFVSLMAVAIVIQIGLAGFGAFDTADKLSSKNSTVDEKSFENSFGPHAALGTLIVISGLVLLLISFGTRDGRRMKRSGIIFGLLVAQLLLAWFGPSVPWLLGVLHPLNAFVILSVVGLTAYQEWTIEKAPEAEAAPAMPAA